METLKNIDALLAQMNVSGDNVMLLAAARSALNKLYNKMKEDENASENGK